MRESTHHNPTPTPGHCAAPSRTVRARGGFTLLEMLIVGMLGMLVITFVGNSTRWYSRSIKDMHVSAQLGHELKMASEAIAQDFGRSLAAQTTDGTTLQLNYDSGDSIAQWAAPDTVIQYTIQGGVLLRQDLNAATEIVIARNITNLNASIVGGNLNVHLVAGYRQTVQDLTLQLQDP